MNVWVELKSLDTGIKVICDLSKRTCQYQTSDKTRQNTQISLYGLRQGKTGCTLQLFEHTEYRKTAFVVRAQDVPPGRVDDWIQVMIKECVGDW